MMPSQVRWICMRENAEYSASNDAAFIALMQTEPLAKNTMYGTTTAPPLPLPPVDTCPTSAPKP